MASILDNEEFTVDIGTPIQPYLFTEEDRKRKSPSPPSSPLQNLSLDSPAQRNNIAQATLLNEAQIEQEIKRARDDDGSKRPISDDSSEDDSPPVSPPATPSRPASAADNNSTDSSLPVRRDKKGRIQCSAIKVGTTELCTRVAIGDGLCQLHSMMRDTQKERFLAEQLKNKQKLKKSVIAYKTKQQDKLLEQIKDVYALKKDADKLERKKAASSKYIDDAMSLLDSL
jgi:hypothetical protein